MIDRIHIQNYRGIHELEIRDLRPLTVFTGDNGCGKTTVLEAMLLWFAEGNPRPLLALQNSRGSSGYTDLSPVTRSLFHGFKDVGTATIAAGHGRSPEKILKIVKKEPSHVAPEQAGILPDEITSGVPPSRVRAEGDVRFTWQGKTRATVTWDYRAKPPMPRIENGRAPQRQATMMFPTVASVGFDETARFGEIKEAGRTEAVFSPLRQFDPRITDIDWISARGGYFGVLLGKPPYVPLGALGGGINRLFTMLLHMDWCRDEFLGIDEVENGFHHSKLPGVFGTLLEGRSASNLQLALATHSHEALDAIVHAAERHSIEDLAIVHLRRDEGDTVKAFTYVGRDALSAVDLGYELR